MMGLDTIPLPDKKRPRVIFLDAMGTLFGLQESVGTLYAQIAGQYGVKVSSSALDNAFITAFKETTPLAFPEVDPAQIPDLEYQWWQAIAKTTFEQADVFAQFTDFKAFFADLYAYFASPTPWILYPDVLPTLTDWRNQGITLAIISNFDSRLHQILTSLNIHHFFSTITLSSFAGFAKPHPNIFHLALNEHQCLPHQAWHIGDSLRDDYEGAKNAGLQAFLLKR